MCIFIGCYIMMHQWFKEEGNEKKLIETQLNINTWLGYNYM